MQLPSFLPPHLATLLRAVTRTDEAGRSAFLEWRATTRLDDITGPAFKMLPVLGEMAKRTGTASEELGRMNGVARYIWVANMLQLKALSRVLDILGNAQVPTMVIKGAALFARNPDLARRRMVADYDILVPGEFRVPACEVLQQAGFQPGQGFSWAEVKYGMHDRSGAPISDGQGEIDLHWRPLQQIHDETLSQSFLRFAEREQLRGIAVTVPSVTDHLFATLVRAEPNDAEEAFYRLCEAALLVSHWIDKIDWQRLASMARRYGYDLRVRRFLSILVTECGLSLPPAALAIGQDTGTGTWWDEALRTWVWSAQWPLVRWFHAQRDQTSDRRDAARPPVRLAGAIALQTGWLTGDEFRRQWRDAIYLEQAFPARGLRFGPGFSSDEAAGRWTDGRFAALRVPLPGKAVRHVTLQVVPHTSRWRAVTVLTCTGVDVRRHRLRRPGDITVELEPVPELGGDALVLFYLGFARSPVSTGVSSDVRELGLFLPHATTDALGPYAPDD
jgi:hypothetical protein